MSSRIPTLPRGRAASMLLVIAVIAAQMLLGAGAANALDWNCKQPPATDYPGSSLVGHLDQPEVGRGKPTTPYGDYAYAGQKWFTYDTGCMGDPGATTDTEIGNESFNVAKTVVATINGAHWLQDTDGALKPLDDLVSTMSVDLYDHVFTPYIGVALSMAAIAVLGWTLRGNLAQVGKSAFVIIVALGVAAATYLTPLVYTTLADGLLNNGVNQLERQLLDNGQYSARDALPNTLHDQVVYSNWLKGEFGESNSPEARQHGRELLDAQACSKIQIVDAEVAGKPCPVDQKKAAFTRVGNELSNTPAYGFFTGTNGSRTGAGIGAILESLCYGSFQMLALFALFLAKLILRILVLSGPIIGLVAVVYHPVLKKAGHAAGTAVAHGAVLAVASMVHLRILEWVLGPRELGIGYIGQLLISGLITVVFWVAIKPHRKFRNMMEASMKMGGLEVMPWEQLMQRRFLRRMRRGQANHRQEEERSHQQIYNNMLVMGGSRPESASEPQRVPPAQREYDPPYQWPAGALPEARHSGADRGSPEGPGTAQAGHTEPPPRGSTSTPSKPSTPSTAAPDSGADTRPHRATSTDETARGSSGTTRPHQRQSNTSSEEPEVIVPSERWSSQRPEHTWIDDEQHERRRGPPEPAPSRQEGETRVWNVYRPSSRRVESEQHSSETPDRPESQE